MLDLGGFGMNKHLLSLILVSTLFHGFVQGQKSRVEEQHLQFAESMLALFPNSQAASIESTSDYGFTYNSRTSQLEINSEESRQLVSLGYDVVYTERNYFSEKVRVDSYTLRNSKNRAIDHDKLCGHYTANGIFHSDAQVCVYKFSFANKGQYGVFTSSKTYLDAKYFTTAYFHKEAPAQNRKISFEIPSWVDVELIEMNFEGYEIAKNVINEGDLRLVTYNVKNLDGYPREENLPGSSHYLPHILMLTKGYTREGQHHDVLSSTGSLYKWYKSLTEGKTNNEETLRQLVDEVTKGLTLNEEKLKAIYYWVQDNIKYIAFEEGLAAFKPEESIEVYSKKYGDCKGMANLTTDMLRLAGFDARLTWLGTNRINYTYDVPSLAVDNHMICSVNLDGEFLYLDATEKNNSIGQYAERIQGKQVLIEDGDSYIIEKIPVESIDKYLTKTSVDYFMNEGVLMASGVDKIRGEYKKELMNLYDAISSKQSDIFYKTIVSGDLETSDVVISNVPNLERDDVLELKYDVTLRNHLNQFDKDIYLDLDFKKEFEDYRIATERKTPFRFSSKINKQFEGDFTVPEGFEVTHLPDDVLVESSHFRFSLAYKLEGNRIRYLKEMKVFDTYLPPEKFDVWNAAINNVKDFYDDQIILSGK